ncbi:ATP-dependent helicase HrpB [Novispirillum sp. DQ9]|uniref:ATP-dependent helicase HrpB n=1 Tax=Novispirillum sp. DQ9 TaxID=3398612 RepID=UPI003C7D4734
MSAFTTDLPIAEVLPALRDALAAGPNAVVQAPPGAGKTTAVPLALLDAPWLAGRKIILLEPRRLAARMAARRMASLLGEEVGATVGYRIRQERKVSSATRIEVVTEGVLTRQLQSDPDLSGVACVLFDEFHERSLHADLGLALCLEVQAALRDDLRLVAMSATLDAAPVAALMGGAPVITSEGRAFPVETRFLPPRPTARLEDTMASAIRTAVAEESGSILAFLPGEAEIRRVAERLDGLPPEVDLAPLYGALPPEAQDAAVRPAPAGRRKVVLATAIAETSLTIDGIRVVIDGGLARRAAFDPRSGMTRLVTERVTRAAADQRRGRAGRLMPGVCYRLWPEAEDRALLAAPPPEIRSADLAPLLLDLAAWGAEPDALPWLDAPPPAAVAQARDLLRGLGALDAQGRVTAHGKAMAELPLHPRLAHMILAAREHGLGGLACDVAALLSERDPVKGGGRGGRDADLRLRLDLLHGGRADGLSLDRGALARARQDAGDWRRRLGLPRAEGTVGAGACLALAYPDRVGRRRAQGGYTLSGGRGAVLADGDPLGAEDFLAVGDLDGAAQNGRIYLAAPLTRAEIEDLFADAITEGEVVRWDDRSESVVARRQRRLGACVLDDKPLPAPDPARLAEGLIDGIRRTGPHVLPWDKRSEQLRARIAFLHAAEGAPWPDVCDTALLAGLENWLAPYLSGMSKLAHLRKLDLAEALKALLPWDLQQRLEREAPTHFQVPTGSRIALDYSTGETPVLAVRLQEMFGCTDHPAIAGGRVPLVVHLLSPAHRPIQVTQDLPGFWTSSYAAVKADMKGRYPKHPWPDDPVAAAPTTRAKPRGT